MKKRYWIIIVTVVLMVLVFAVCRYCIYDTYELLFHGEDVQSVTLSTIWEYKIIENRDEIEKLISQFNEMRIVPNDIPSKYQIADGSIGYTVYFELTDGRQLEYSVVQMQSGGIYFTDAENNKWSARNFSLDKTWNQLDAETYPPTPRNFYAICYQGQIYKGTADVMEVPKDAQFVGTVTGITYSPNCELECSRGKTGQNVYVWQENEIGKIGVEIEQNVWPDPQAAVIDIGSTENSMDNVTQ